MKKLSLLITLLIVFAANISKAENYAILISAGYVAEDDIKNRPRIGNDSAKKKGEYWYDLFLAYEALLIKGYSHENIIVFYGDGNDFNSIYPRYNIENSGWEDGIVDFDNSRNTLITEFANLAQITTREDNLLIWWTVGHGNANQPDGYYAMIERPNVVQGESIGERTICAMIDQLNYNKRIIIWMTCHSGGLIEGDNHFNFDRTIILTSSPWDQPSKTSILDELPHAELTYCITSALSGKTPNGTPYDADLNGDNKISVEELFNDAVNNSIMRSDPQLKDESMIADTTFIGIEPESSEPDNADDALTEHFPRRKETQPYLVPPPWEREINSRFFKELSAIRERFIR